MTVLLHRALIALLRRGCTPRQLRQCSIPAELVEDEGVRVLAAILVRHRNTDMLERAVEMAARELRTQPRPKAAGVDDAPAGRRRGNIAR